MTSPTVSTTYADGSGNTVRPESRVYPDGRTVTFDYGVAGGINDRLSRIEALVDEDDTVLAEYRYLGLGAVVEQDSPEADLRSTLVSLTETNDPDTGDIYSGLDRFGRVQDVRWRDVSASSDLARVQYGYDRASNRTWRKNPSDPQSRHDWFYGYDALQRLKDADRGTLASPPTGVTSPQFAQCWSLDATGNWAGFRQANSGDPWSLVQTRTANAVNEITGITNSTGSAWAQPAYDPAGNMTTIPRPAVPAPVSVGWSTLTVDDWSGLSVEGWAALPVEGSSGTVSDESETFTAVYDAWNRLVKLVDPATDDVVQENVYDARGYRVIRKSYAAGVLTETRHYYYTNGWRCVEERLGTSPDSAPAERQHVWGVRYIDDLICRDRQASLSSSSSSSSSGGRRLAERLYACQDGNWNVMAVVGTDGAVAERYEYDPYGQLTVRTPNFSPRGASSYDWNINYAGYRLDAETGLYQVRFRFLHPRFMWVTRDPIGYAAGMHLTQFVYSNPESFIDPMGLDPFNLNPAWDHHPDTPSLPPKPGDWISGGQWTFEDTVLSDMSYWGESRGSDGTWANAGLWAHYTLTTTARLKGTVLCGDSCGTTRKVNIDIQIMLVLDITQKLDNNVTARLKFILPWKWKSIVYMASAIQASLNYQRLQQLAEKSSGITSKGACLLAKAGVTDVTSSTIIRARMVIGDIAPNPDEKGPERWIPGPVLLPEFTPNPK